MREQYGMANFACDGYRRFQRIGESQCVTLRLYGHRGSGEMPGRNARASEVLTLVT